MSCSEGHLVRPGQTVLPPLSDRTLHHPSFLPLYVAAGFAQHQQRDGQTVQPIIPAEIFYTEPSSSCGSRIPNALSELRLNTPPPVMSACLAPPNCPDPFTSGPHLTRDLGSPTWRKHTIHAQVQLRRGVIQLTQEEDQAITNLLKLHHQDSVQSDDNLTAAQMDFFDVVERPFDLNPASFLHSTSAEPVCADGRYLKEAGRSWSETELEAANALLSLFDLKEYVVLQCKTAETLPDCLLCQSTGTQQEAGTVPPLETGDWTQNDISSTSFSCVWETGDILSVEDRSAGDCFRPLLEDNLASSLPARLSSDVKSRSSVFGGCLEMNEQMLSDSEGDVVHVLLSLSDADIMQ